MKSRELEQIGVELFGSHGWRSKLARGIGVHRNTIYRWMNENEVPHQWAKYIKYFYDTNKPSADQQELGETDGRANSV